MNKFRQLNKDFDYQWVIVFLCVLMFGTSMGFVSNGNTGFYLPAITEALDFSRSAFSITSTIRFATTTGINLFFGLLIRRFGTKKLICSGYFFLMLFCVTNALAETLPAFYVGSIFLGVGLSFTGTAMAGSVVSKWCKGNRGTIMGIITATNGIAGALATQILVPIIHQKGTVFGYRQSYWLVVLILLLALIITLFLFRETPPSPSHPTLANQKKKRRGQEWSGIKFEEIKKLPFFYLTLLCLFLSGIMLNGLTNVSTVHMLDVGLHEDYVAILVSISSLLVTGTKFLSGVAYDRFGLKTTLKTCNIAAAVSMFLLAFVSNNNWGKLIAVAYYLIHTLATPLTSIMISILATDLFGDISYDEVSGLFVSVSTAGFALGAPVMNLVYDFWGTYQPALLVCGLLMIIVTIMFQYIISAAHKKRLEIEV